MLLAVADHREPAGLPPSVEKILSFYETVGSLLRRGHLDRPLMYGLFGYNVQMWWGWLAPRVRYDRAQAREPKMWEDFEWLRDWIVERARRGEVIVDDELPAASLPAFLSGSQSSVRLAEDLRAVIVRPMAADAPANHDRSVGSPV